MIRPEQPVLVQVFQMVVVTTPHMLVVVGTAQASVKDHAIIIVVWAVAIQVVVAVAIRDAQRSAVDVALHRGGRQKANM